MLKLIIKIVYRYTNINDTFNDSRKLKSSTLKNFFNIKLKQLCFKEHLFRNIYNDHNLYSFTFIKLQLTFLI